MTSVILYASYAILFEWHLNSSLFIELKGRIGGLRFGPNLNLIGANKEQK